MRTYRLKNASTAMLCAHFVVLLLLFTAASIMILAASAKTNNCRSTDASARATMSKKTCRVVKTKQPVVKRKVTTRSAVSTTRTGATTTTVAQPSTPVPAELAFTDIAEPSPAAQPPVSAPSESASDVLVFEMPGSYGEAAVKLFYNPVAGFFVDEPQTAPPSTVAFDTLIFGPTLTPNTAASATTAAPVAVGAVAVGPVASPGPAPVATPSITTAQTAPNPTTAPPATVVVVENPVGLDPVATTKPPSSLTATTSPGNAASTTTLATGGTGSSLGKGFMGSNIWGVPFSTDRNVDPIIGVGSLNETQALKATIGINFRATETGGLDYFRTYWTTNSGAPGNYYAGGTGGTVRIRLYNADANGFPIGSELDEFLFSPRLVNGYQPSAVPAYQVVQFAPLDFPKNPTVVRGQNYVVEFENIDPDPKTNFIRLMMTDFYEDYADNSGGTSYLGVGNEFSRGQFGMVFRLGGGGWLNGNSWESSNGRHDPLPIFGAKLTTGGSFGNSGWLVAVDHERYHGVGNPLGSGCDQNGGPSGSSCDYQPGRISGEEFRTGSDLQIRSIMVPLNPVTGGSVTFRIREMASGNTVTSCAVNTPTLDQSPNHPSYAFIRSRQFGCALGSIATLKAGVTYRLEVVSSGATGSVLVLGDARVWPFAPAPPMAEMQGAGIDGQFVSPAGTFGLFDMQFGLGLA